MSLRTSILGVLNVTPDSFSDGGRYHEPRAAIEHGLAMAAAGADVVDVGGESTRPGAPRVPTDEEQQRVLPVIRELVRQSVTVSIDTMNAATARAAAEAGVAYLNDVSGGLADPEMATVACDTGLPYIVMHWRGHSTDMDALATYDDVVADVKRELLSRVDALTNAGVDPGQLILDPGLGFAKTGEHNWQILNRLGEFVSLGFPVLIGASRKRFLGALPTIRQIGRPDAVVLDSRSGPDARGPGAQPRPYPPAERQSPPRTRESVLDAATGAVSALAAGAGVWGVRVHDVTSTRIALEAAESWLAGAETSSKGES